MDAKTEKSLSRIREELALYEPIAAALEVNPGESGHLQIPILQTLIRQHKRTIECVETGEPFLASQYTNPVELLTAMDVHWYFHIQQMFAGSGSGGGLHVEEDLEAMDKLAVAGCDPVYGARPLKRAIQHSRENPLAQALLEGRYGRGDTVRVSYQGDEFCFEKATVAAA